MSKHECLGNFVLCECQLNWYADLVPNGMGYTLAQISPGYVLNLKHQRILQVGHLGQDLVLGPMALRGVL